MAEADFGRLGLLKELGTCRPRMVQGFILTLSYSRLTCIGMSEYFAICQGLQYRSQSSGTGEFKTARFGCGLISLL